MKAIMFEEFGGPDVLSVREAATPRPAPGQVRIRVRAAGLNQLDFKIRSGVMQQVFPTTFPAVPGVEAAGETAQRVLDLLAVKEGETLLVHGAAGAVGGIAVQLAVAVGVAVIGTSAPANHDHLRSLGVTPVAYGAGLVDRVRALAPQGVDAVFDAAGYGALPDSIELRGGTTERVVTIADPAARDLGVVFSAGGQRSAATLAEHARLAAAGTLRVTVAATFPLEEAGRAQERSATGHNRGKIVLRP